ncbi:MAG TPA: DNA primase [Candidatus Portnoybacteria bacterium]|nr:DNA primase [Candidatus Portnoybacteria bacterium]
MISNEVEEIKNRLDIIEVIGGYIKLIKAGRNYKALCPFHQEKTPSFIVSPEKQIWHCFGCGRGGDIFTFVMEIEHLDFYETLKILARRAGIELKKENPQKKSQRQKFLSISEIATKFFETQLWKSNSGRKILNYLKKRGLDNETIKKWRIGWIPDDWQSLSNFLAQKYSIEDLIQVGLSIAKKNNPNEVYDRFRSRIIFPIFDLNNQPIAFSGRIFGKDESQAKYINTPETILYQKSYQLMGLNFANRVIREKNFCILVEGNLDVILSHQSGHENTVAPCGTGFTSEQAKIISRYTNNLAIAFDSDEAGQNATVRTIGLTLKQKFNVSVVQICKKDPADLILENPELWNKSVKNRTPAIDFYFQKIIKNQPETILEKKKIIEKILPLIQTITDPIEKDEWIKRLSQETDIRENIIHQELDRMKKKANIYYPTTQEFNHSNNKPPEKKIFKNRLEERLLLLLFWGNENKLDIYSKIEKIKEEYFFNSLNLKIFQIIKKFYNQDIKSIINQTPSELSPYLSQIVFDVDKIKNYSVKLFDQEFEDIIARLEEKFIKKKIIFLSQELAQLEKYQSLNNNSPNEEMKLKRIKLSELILQQKQIQEKIFNQKYE